MKSLADLTPKELGDLKRMLKARVERRSKAILRAQADRMATQLRLDGVSVEQLRRAKLRGGNSAKPPKRKAK